MSNCRPSTLGLRICYWRGVKIWWLCNQRMQFVLTMSIPVNFKMTNRSFWPNSNFCPMHVSPIWQTVNSYSRVFHVATWWAVSPAISYFNSSGQYFLVSRCHQKSKTMSALQTLQGSWKQVINAALAIAFPRFFVWNIDLEIVRVNL